MKYIKSQIFKMAWAAAKKAAEFWNDKASKFFAESLRMAYAWVKSQKKVVVVPNWFFEQRFGYGVGSALRRGTVIKETEKAYLVDLDMGLGQEFWCPKSIIK
ncbi:MAG: hypothetical protein ACLT3H_02865 [Roseburia sp.]